MVFIPGFLNLGTVVQVVFFFFSFYLNNRFHFHSGIEKIFLLSLFSNLFELHFQLIYNSKPIKLYCVLFAKGELHVHLKDKNTKNKMDTEGLHLGITK